MLSRGRGRPTPKVSIALCAWVPLTAEIFEVSVKPDAVRQFWFHKAHIAGCLKHMTLPRVGVTNRPWSCALSPHRRAWTQTLTRVSARLCQATSISKPIASEPIAADCSVTPAASKGARAKVAGQRREWRGLLASLSVPNSGLTREWAMDSILVGAMPAAAWHTRASEYLQSNTEARERAPSPLARCPVARRLHASQQ